ncbi:MAG TPA: protoheme IX farnesyltransferase [Gammaproteobacteria bacterium]|nr:protoheme IX farnesyltransferase [Gammaproteobacteria bacterium]
MIMANWKDYYELCKPKVVALIIFTAVVGMFMATDTINAPGLMVPWNALIFGTLGIGLASASAAAINHVVDQHVDAEMSRTHNRPLPTGNITSKQALVFALTMGVVAMVILVVWINLLTAALTLTSLIGYAVIYTLYLKRATPQNIVIGGAAGAAPPVLGWAAVTNSIDPGALWLFMIIFIWTPPHFWALAIHRRDEYAKVDIPMLPVTHGVQFTSLQVLLYTILLIIVSLMPYLTHMSGLLYLVGTVALDAGFLYYALKLKGDSEEKADERIAMKTFGYSIFYLMGIFALLLIDHYVPAMMTLLS